MPSMNRIFLVGHLGNDPEVKPVAQTNVGKFSLATSHKEKDEYVTDWHRVVCWGKLAEYCQSNLGKGDLAFVEGQLQCRTWEDREGKKVQTWEVVASNVFKMMKKYSSESGGDSNPF